MVERVEAILNELIARLPALKPCRGLIADAFALLSVSFAGGGKLLVCGNGGSAADGEHIVGELMKGFLLRRKLPERDAEKFARLFPEDGAALASRLQRALPALSLNGHAALSSAFINDVDPSMVYAQQVWGLGREGDVLLGITTSGNSLNVLNAVKAAKAAGIKTVGLTGGSGGKLRGLCDVTVVVPAEETFRVQEYHLPVYHALCAMLEEAFFG